MLFLIKISNKHLFMLPSTGRITSPMMLVSEEPFVGLDYVRVFTTAAQRSEAELDPITGALHQAAMDAAKIYRVHSVFICDDRNERSHDTWESSETRHNPGGSFLRILQQLEDLAFNVCFRAFCFFHVGKRFFFLWLLFLCGEMGRRCQLLCWSQSLPSTSEVLARHRNLFRGRYSIIVPYVWVNAETLQPVTVAVRLLSPNQLWPLSSGSPSWSCSLTWHFRWCAVFLWLSWWFSGGHDISKPSCCAAMIMAMMMMLVWRSSLASYSDV